MNGFIRCAMPATAVVLMLVAFGVAQERRNPQKAEPTPAQSQNNVSKIRQPQTAQPEQRQAAEWQKEADRQMATWLWAESEAKIELAKWVIDRTKNADVKEFAQQVVYDHGEYLEQLRRFGAAPPTAQDDEADTGAPNRDDEYQEKPAEDYSKLTQQFFNNPFSLLTRSDEVQASATRENKRPITGPLEIVRVKHEIAQQNVATVKNELRQKARGEFEKCFVGQQFLGHLMMVDTLKVMKRYASEDLRLVIDQGEKTAEEQLDHARMLMNDMNPKHHVEFEPIALQE